MFTIRSEGCETGALDVRTGCSGEVRNSWHEIATNPECSSVDIQADETPAWDALWIEVINTMGNQTAEMMQQMKTQRRVGAMAPSRSLHPWRDFQLVKTLKK